jgi:hypothetical protein
MILHPIFVHFPIALLTVYALIELAPIGKFFADKPAWFYIKTAMLIIGEFSIFFAFQTGDALEHMFRSDAIKNNIVQIHAFLAGATVWWFGMISILYAAAWAEREGIMLRVKLPSRIKKVLDFLIIFQNAILTGWWIKIAAFIGLIGLILTGASGGLLVHGPDADPLAGLIYKWSLAWMNK